MRSPRWEDFEYTYVDEYDSEGNKVEKRANRLAWLGNGWSSNQLEGDTGHDLAWYLYPEFMDRPVAPKPEEKGVYSVRPFSY